MELFDKKFMKKLTGTYKKLVKKLQKPVRKYLKEKYPDADPRLLKTINDYNLLQIIQNPDDFEDLKKFMFGLLEKYFKKHPLFKEKKKES